MRVYMGGSVFGGPATAQDRGFQS